MRYNAFKNLGELYERTGDFQKAKDIYTQVTFISFIIFRLSKSKQMMLSSGAA